MRTKLACVCEREIPVRAAWAALCDGKTLRCTACGEPTTPADLVAIVDVEEAADRDRAAIVACLQLRRYGWTSYDSINNAVTLHDGRSVGGMLAGFQRAGLIQRIEDEPSSMAAMIVQTKPMFEPGPMFPGA